jgi:hypothetical protein
MVCLVAGVPRRWLRQVGITESTELEFGLQLVNTVRFRGSKRKAVAPDTVSYEVCQQNLLLFFLSLFPFFPVCVCVRAWPHTDGTYVCVLAWAPVSWAVGVSPCHACSVLSLCPLPSFRSPSCKEPTLGPLSAGECVTVTVPVIVTVTVTVTVTVSVSVPVSVTVSVTVACAVQLVDVTHDCSCPWLVLTAFKP